MGDSPKSPFERKRSHDDDDIDGKKQKNREAARKCREKKYKETEQLKKENDDLMKKNNELSRKKQNLENMLQECIDEIVKHKQSGCILPPNVAAIISMAECSPDFIPVGTQVTAIQNNELRTATPKKTTRAQNIFLPTDSQEISHATGMFSGDQIPTHSIGRPRSRNPSSGSSSTSPPPSVSSQSQSCNSSLRRMSAKLTVQPNWNLVHQQTIKEQSSPGLSPAQTVPNIDSAAETFRKQNGFPDIEEAVQQAQQDPGVTEDDGYQNQDSLMLNAEKGYTQSTGFIPNLASTSFSVPSTQFQYNLGENSLSSISNSTILRPTPSNSNSVSMNHTAELLSQAINNFDASEISEDLKKQYEQLAKTQDNKETQPTPQGNQTFDQNDYYMQENTAVDQCQSTNQLQGHSSSGNDNEISYDTLLRLAKDQEQNITVQYLGTEYQCNYEQVEQLIHYISNQRNTTQITDNDLSQHCYLTSQAVTGVTSNSLNQNNYCVTENQVFSQANTFGHDVNPMPITQVIETPVQTTQLPTTVISMIEQDAVAQPGPFMEASVDSDYSENVRDLPSLCLTEDHTNIFEKRSKTLN